MLILEFPPIFRLLCNYHKSNHFESSFTPDFSHVRSRSVLSLAVISQEYDPVPHPLPLREPCLDLLCNNIATTSLVDLSGLYKSRVVD